MRVCVLLGFGLGRQNCRGAKARLTSCQSDKSSAAEFGKCVQGVQLKTSCHQRQSCCVVSKGTLALATPTPLLRLTHRPQAGCTERLVGLSG